MKNDVISSDLDDGSPSVGFRLLARKRRLKFDLDCGGIAALESLLAALIRSGISSLHDLIAEVSAVTGDHIEDVVIRALVEGHERLWWSHDDDTYSPMDYF